MPSMSWEHAAGILWPKLVQAAHSDTLLSYSHLAQFISQPPINVGRALDPIQQYCQDTGLPPLTVLVGDKYEFVPGSGFIGASREHLDEAIQDVRQFDWSSRSNPFLGFEQADSIESLGKRLTEEPSTCGDVYTKIKARGIAQRVFRQALLGAYDGQCAICGLTFEAALEAAHIIPWTETDGALRVDPRNGMLMCALHHSLFDNASITVSRSLKIMYYDPQRNDGEYSDIDQKMVADFHGIEILKPEHVNLRPDPDLLARRNKNLRWRNIP